MNRICQTGDPFWTVVLACTLSEQNHTNEFYNFPMAALVWRWRKFNSPTVFPDNESLIDILHSSRLAIKPSSLKPRWPVFSFSPPLGAMMDKIKLFPFLFSVSSGVDQMNDMQNMLNDCPVPTKFDFSNTRPTEEMKAYISIDDGCGLAWNTDFLKFIEVLNSGEDFEEIKGLDKSENTAERNKSIRAHAKLAVMLLVYAQAFPESVAYGFPSGFPEADAKFGGKGHGARGRITGIKILAPIDTATGRALHLRRGHFRSLHDERFKRNIDGSIKIVWVRESVIGGKIDPYTVEAHVSPPD